MINFDIKVYDFDPLENHLKAWTSFETLLFSKLFILPLGTVHAWRVKTCVEPEYELCHLSGGLQDLACVA